MMGLLHHMHPCSSQRPPTTITGRCRRVSRRALLLERPVGPGNDGHQKKSPPAVQMAAAAAGGEEEASPQRAGDGRGRAGTGPAGAHSGGLVLPAATPHGRRHATTTAAAAATVAGAAAFVIGASGPAWCWRLPAAAADAAAAGPDGRRVWRSVVVAVGGSAIRYARIAGCPLKAPHHPDPSHFIRLHTTQACPHRRWPRGRWGANSMRPRPRRRGRWGRSGSPL